MVTGTYNDDVSPLRPSALLLLLLGVFASSLVGQPRLVKDINLYQSPVGSWPAGLASIGNVTYFFADHPDTGNELWKTDGTESGTVLVRDILPGPGDGVSDIGFITRVLDNRLIFRASDGVHGFELWATDGTRDGTVQLVDITPTNQSPLLNWGPVVGSTLYFAATHDPSIPRELWRTDGTPAGTRRVVPGNTIHSVTAVAPLGSLLLFTGYAGESYGLYATDGTEEGTRLFAPFPASFGVSLGDSVLFVRIVDGGERRLMRTDGTSSGTTLIQGGFTAIDSMLVIDGVAYFGATNAANGNELWRSDGTIAGTRLVADLTPGTEGTQISLRAVLGNRLLFVTPGKLWISDGTAAGTQVVKELPYVSGGAVSGAFFYFVNEDAVHGRELWKTDGTTAGTTLVADVDGTPSDSIQSAYLLARPGGGVLFPANDRISGTEPWIADDTGTRMLKNITAETRIGSYPRNLANIGGRLFFDALSGLWTSDGTPEGTTRVDAAGLKPTNSGPGPRGMASGNLYFLVSGDLPALELWRSDGNASGTFRLFTMNASRYIESMTPFRGGLFFAGWNPEQGLEPWFTDGTQAGTRVLADTVPGPDSGFSDAGGANIDETTLLFRVQGKDGYEYWLTDGTSEGTRRMMLLDRDEWENIPSDFTKFGDTIFFLGKRRQEWLTLFRVDPSTGDFVAVRQIENQLFWTSIWKVAGVMLFTAGKELWRSDGTEAGTFRIHEAIVPGCSVAGDDLLYWYVFPDYVPELWRSDGTAEGTFRLGRFPGSYAESLQTCRPRDLHYSDGRLYFIGRDIRTGAEPWVSDGTLLGTRMLWDVNPGPASSDPGSFMRIGRTLFFAANEPGAGRELWAMETGCEGGDCPPRRRRARH